ncbi:hypothetical protein EOM09_07765, partial [bacterium]|nr:hypothetical protein [bacterium]
MTKEFYFTNSRFKFIAGILLLIFLVFMFLIYLKAEEISKNPCKICAEKMGEDVICMNVEGVPITILFESNDLIEES